jgi:hypothetical protein
MESLNVITVIIYIFNRLRGASEALILMEYFSCVMGAVIYGRKKISVAVK